MNKPRSAAEGDPCSAIERRLLDAIWLPAWIDSLREHWKGQVVDTLKSPRHRREDPTLHLRRKKRTRTPHSDQR